MSWRLSVSRNRRQRRRSSLACYSPVFEWLEERRLLAVVSLNPIADATLYEESSNPANGAGQNLFAGVTANSNQNALRRAILKFDVASAIPAGSTINSASLQLTVNRVPGNAKDANMSVHRVTADWGEGTTDAGGQEGQGQSPPSANSATWNHRFFSDVLWAMPGGDFNATPSASILVAGLGDYQWTSENLVADVQQWLAAPSAQLGWVLKADQESSSAGRNAKRFAARENPDANVRPVLTIDFTEAAAPNQPPTLDPIPDPAAFLEDAGQQTVNLAGITAGNGESQTLTVTAESSNPGLIPTPSVNYVSPSSTGSLSFAPVANQSGSAVIMLTVMDDGGTADGGQDTTVRSFTVTVQPVNDPPTVDTIADPPSILEDAGSQTVDLQGITAGPNESQTLTATAVSSNPDLIPNPNVTYTSPNTSGTLAFAPAENQSGSAIITVTVADDGDTSNGGINTISTVFTLSITSVNDAPTLDTIDDPPNVPENSGVQRVDLSGIGAGGGESQTLTVTATSNNPSLVPDPVVEYSSPNATGSLSFTPVSDQTGTAMITVTVMDDGGTENGGVDKFTRLFSVTVVGVNHAPTLDPIPDPQPIDEDAALQTVDLTGISSGDGELQLITLNVATSNPDLIPLPTVAYTSPNDSGTLTYQPVADRSGSSVITVTVQDDGGTENGGSDTLTRSFTVTVNPVNDNPALDEIADPATLLEDAGAQTIDLSGISAGPNESQPLRVTAISDNPELIPTPEVTYTSPQAVGSVKFMPAADRSGAATISVIVEDAGLDGDLGTTEDNGSTERKFTVSVDPVNDLPTIDKPQDQDVDVNASEQTVALTGISAGGGESQPLSISVVSSDESIVPTPTVEYLTPEVTGNLKFTPVTDAVGAVTITLIVSDGGLDGNLVTTEDNGLFEQTFNVRVGIVNETPTLDEIADRTILEDAQEQAVSLTGITAGAGETQELRVTASSSAPALIPHPNVSYTSSESTGELRFRPLSDQSGSAVLTVVVEDAGPDGNFDAPSDNSRTERKFTITVSPVNDAPLAAADELAVQQGASTILPLLANDIDVDSPFDTQSFEFQDGPTSGSVSVSANGDVIYTPANAFFGNDSFSYRVADTEGAFSEFVGISLTVNAQPTATDAVAFLEPAVPTEVAPELSDPDGSLDALQIEILSNLDAVVGQVEVVGGTRIRFSSGSQFAGSIEIEWRVLDAQGGASQPAIVLFGVYNQNFDFAEDVNGSGQVSPIDALLTINTINMLGSRAIPPGDDSQPFYDVNADGFVTPLDALIVINFLNHNGSPEGESKISSSEMASVPAFTSGPFGNMWRSNSLASADSYVQTTNHFRKEYQLRNASSEELQSRIAAASHTRRGELFGLRRSVRDVAVDLVFKEIEPVLSDSDLEELIG